MVRENNEAQGRALDDAGAESKRLKQRIKELAETADSEREARLLASSELEVSPWAPRPPRSRCPVPSGDSSWHSGGFADGPVSQIPAAQSPALTKVGILRVARSPRSPQPSSYRRKNVASRGLDALEQRGELFNGFRQG